MLQNKMQEKDAEISRLEKELQEKKLTVQDHTRDSDAIPQEKNVVTELISAEPNPIVN